MAGVRTRRNGRRQGLSRRAGPALAIDRGAIAKFCRRWRVQELALFGSVLTAAFRPRSDVDVLVTFRSDAGWSLLDLVRAREELTTLIGRPVDLVEPEGLRNPIRRRAILAARHVVYAA